jgi:hypothetical protein
MSYERDLDQVCVVLGYDSYADYCAKEAVTCDPSDMGNVTDAWNWLLGKMSMHLSIDFQNYVYPLIYGRFGIEFKFLNDDDPHEEPPVGMEIHNISEDLAFMRWLAVDVEQSSKELSYHDRIIRYLKSLKWYQNPGDFTYFRELDYCIATGYYIKDTKRRMTDEGRVPVLMLSPFLQK